jgi:hypothetical protein
MSNPSTVYDLVNALDDSISTIKHLAELGPLIDGYPEYFCHGIELLSLIAREIGHAEKLSTQLSRVVLPRPHAMEDPR